MMVNILTYELWPSLLSDLQHFRLKVKVHWLST